MMSPSILSGSKFNQTHQSYVKGVVPILLALKESTSIKKIMLGPIQRTAPGHRYCKLRSINGNLITLLYRDVSAAQIIRVVSKNIEQSKQLIADILEGNKPKKKIHKAKSRKFIPKRNVGINNRLFSSSKITNLPKKPAKLAKQTLGTIITDDIYTLFSVDPKKSLYIDLNGLRKRLNSNNSPERSICCYSKKIKKSKDRSLYPSVIAKWLDDGDAIIWCLIDEKWEEVRGHALYIVEATEEEIVIAHKYISILPIERS